MNKKFAFLFPGQGAQYVGMAKDFVKTFPTARLVFEEAEDLLQHSFSRLIFEGSERELTETKNNQLAIFLVGVALSRVFNELYGIKPSFVAGLSLGEYTALHSGGWLSFQDALQLVQKRGLFMNEACELFSGTMAVVLGLEGKEVKNLVNTSNLPNDLWVANYNCPGQVVISGTIKGVEKGSQLAKEAGARRILPLQVHGAFHSGLMEPAKLKLVPYIKSVALLTGSAPVVMNVPGKIVNTVEEIRRYLIDQVTHSVCWEEGMNLLKNGEVDCFIEFGPGKTLSGMNKKIGVSAPTFSIDKLEDLAAFSEALKEKKW